jgi:hypothetical protein
LDTGLSLNTNDWMRLVTTTATNRYVIPFTNSPSCGFYRLVFP